MDNCGSANANTYTVCIGTDTAFFRKPQNQAVVQGSSVTFQCGAHGGSLSLFWFNSLCALLPGNTFFECRNDTIYTPYPIDTVFTANDKFLPRFYVSTRNNITLDLNINSTQLTDAGVYLCSKDLVGLTDLQHSSSAQLIVLGNYPYIRYSS